MTTSVKKKSSPIPSHTVLTLYRELEEHRLLYTLRSCASSQTGMPTFTLTVEHLYDNQITERCLENFSEDLEEATAFARLAAAELVFPEHLYDIWEDSLGENALLWRTK